MDGRGELFETANGPSEVANFIVEVEPSVYVDCYLVTAPVA